MHVNDLLSKEEFNGVQGYVSANVNRLVQVQDHWLTTLEILHKGISGVEKRTLLFATDADLQGLYDRIGELLNPPAQPEVEDEPIPNCAPEVSDLQNRIGNFADTVTGNTSRNPRTIIKRIFTELTELAIEEGVSIGEIVSEVSDVFHIEALKLESSSRDLVLPSKLNKLFIGDPDDPSDQEPILGESGDVLLVFLDYLYAKGFRFSQILHKGSQKLDKLEAYPNLAFDHNGDTFFLKPGYKHGKVKAKIKTRKVNIPVTPGGSSSDDDSDW